MPELTPWGPAGSVAPAAFLFHSAWPAVPHIRIPPHLGSRQAGGTCSAEETACPQPGWCCGAGETCSVDGGAFFCCPAGATGPGCSRVCAAGDFQCGSICCANGQTCMGEDGASPYCMNGVFTTTSTSAAPTATTDLTTSPTTTDSSTITTSSSTIPTTTTSASSTQSTSSSHTTTTKPTSKTTTAPTTTSTPASTSTATSPPTSTSTTQPISSGGMSHAAQIAIGVIVPVVVILLVGALWFLMFRRPNPDRSRGRSRTHRRWGTGTSLGIWTGSGPSRDATPPPAYSKDVGQSGSQLSMHEQYLRDAGVGEGIVAAHERDRARGRERSRQSLEILQQGGYELTDLRGAIGPDRGGPGVAARAGDVSPLSGGSSGRSSPHPGNVVVL